MQFMFCLACQIASIGCVRSEFSVMWCKRVVAQEGDKINYACDDIIELNQLISSLGGRVCAMKHTQRNCHSTAQSSYISLPRAPFIIPFFASCCWSNPHTHKLETPANHPIACDTRIYIMLVMLALALVAATRFLNAHHTVRRRRRHAHRFVIVNLHLNHSPRMSLFVYNKS